MGYHSDKAAELKRQSREIKSTKAHEGTLGKKPTGVGKAFAKVGMRSTNKSKQKAK